LIPAFCLQNFQQKEFSDKILLFVYSLLQKYKSPAFFLFCTEMNVIKFGSHFGGEKRFFLLYHQPLMLFRESLTKLFYLLQI